MVTNVEKVHLSGRKWKQKLYRHHTSFPGGLREVNAETLMQRKPEEVLKKAIWGMLPNNRLREVRMASLRLVIGDENPFEDKFHETSTQI